MMMIIKRIRLVEVLVVTVLLLLLRASLHITPPSFEQKSGGGGGGPWFGLPLFAEAAPVVCTTDLPAVTPAQGETVHIRAGECSGQITVNYDDIAIMIHPGAGEFQTGKYIDVVSPSNSVGRSNFTLDISGVDWETTDPLFFPAAGWLSTTTVSYSSISIRDSTFFGYSSFQIGRLRDSAVSIQGSTLNASGLSSLYYRELYDSTVSIQGSTFVASLLTQVYAIRFGGILSSSTVEVQDSTIVPSTSYIGYGIQFGSTVSASSSVKLSRLNIVATTSGATTSYGIHFSRPTLSSSTVEIRDCNITSTAEQDAYGISVSYPFTSSTIKVSDCNVAASGPGTSYGMFFSAEVTSSVVEVSGSSITASQYSLLFGLADVSTLVLRSSHFTGASDGPGPVSVSNKATAVGSLLAECIYWNSDDDYLDVLATSYTSVYTSTQFSSENVDDCATATPSDTSSPAWTQSWSRTGTQSAIGSVSRSQTRSLTSTSSRTGSQVSTSSQSVTSTMSKSSTQIAPGTFSSTPTRSGALSSTQSWTFSATHGSSTSDTFSLSAAQTPTFTRSGTPRPQLDPLIPTPTATPTHSHSSEVARPATVSGSENNALLSSGSAATRSSSEAHSAAGVTPSSSSAREGSGGGWPPPSSTSLKSYTSAPTTSQSGYSLASGSSANSVFIPGTGLGPASGSISSGSTAAKLNSQSERSRSQNSNISDVSGSDLMLSLAASESLHAWLGDSSAGTNDATTVVTSIATFTSPAAALDAQSLAVIGLLSCVQVNNHLALTQNFQVLSPLPTSDTYDGKVLGNLLMACVFVALHVGVVGIMKKVRQLETWAEAQAAARWPSFTWYFLFLLYQGTAAVGIKVLQGSDASAGSLVLGSLAIMLTIPLLPSATGFIVFWKVTSTFHKYEYPGSGEVTVERFVPLFDPRTVGLAPAEEEEVSAPVRPEGASILRSETTPLASISPAVGGNRSGNNTVRTGLAADPAPVDVPSFPRWVSFFLFPTGKWMSQQMRQRYGSFYGALGRYEKFWCTCSTWSPSIIILAVAIQPSTSNGCTSLFAVLASLEFVIAAIILGFRPLRSTPGNTLCACSNICLGFVFVGLALQAQHPASSTGYDVTLRSVQAQLTVTCLRVLWTVVQFILERWVLHPVPLVAQLPEGVWVGQCGKGISTEDEMGNPQEESGLELGLLSVTPKLISREEKEGGQEERTKVSYATPQTAVSALEKQLVNPLTACSSEGSAVVVLGEGRSESDETLSSEGSFDDDLL